MFLFELRVPKQRGAGVFLFRGESVPGFVTMSILGIHRFFRILVYMTFWTCRKRRAPKNHAFRRYSDLQISHGELIGEQNDELNFDVWTSQPTRRDREYRNTEPLRNRTDRPKATLLNYD